MESESKILKFDSGVGYKYATLNPRLKSQYSYNQNSTAMRTRILRYEIKRLVEGYKIV